MKGSILIVDDEPDILRLLEKIISRQADYEIITTNNALEVPRILEKKQFDVICADFKMPGMDGLEILRFVKEQKRFEQVIIITAFGSLESASEAFASGAFDYITKPFKKERILYAVDRAMNYREIAKNVMAMSSIFERLPFDDALAAFKKEYILRLAKAVGSNVMELSGLTGMPAEEISRIFDSH